MAIVQGQAERPLGMCFLVSLRWSLSDHHPVNRVKHLVDPLVPFIYRFLYRYLPISYHFLYIV